MKAAALPADIARPPPLVSRFEFWPDWLFYAPIVAQWLLLGLRHGDMSLPTAANPGIELGGLCGESKGAILDMVAPAQRDTLAPYVVLAPGITIADALATMEQAGLGWPLIGKPDIGCNGTGVCLLHDHHDLARYIAAFPAVARIMLQRYLTAPGEAGIFYVREPDAQQGRITSLTLKTPPHVVGDGRATLAQLVLADPRASRVPALYLSHLGARCSAVPAAGETVRLVLVGNHCKGSIFQDGRDDITPALTQRIDEIARAIPDFHFGRFDVRFASRAALRRGESFAIIEINGVGSEATHVWDAGTRLIDAWADQLAHYRAAFAIGRTLRARGHRPSGVRAMYRNWRNQRRLMAAYPPHD